MLRHFAYGFATLSRQRRLVLRHLRYGRASFASVASPRKAAALATLFRGVNAHLRGLGIDYALSFGTLLGWHREGQLLPHDRDIDFAAPAAAFDAVWQSRRRLPPGFKLHDTSLRHHGPKLYLSHQGWEADIYFYSEENGQLRFAINSKCPGETEPFPHEFLYPLQPAVLLGEPTFVPAQPVALLKHHYGYIGPNAVLDPVTLYYRPRGEPARGAGA